MRVLSYNIHKGFNLGNRSVVLTAIRDAIHAVDADLVLLQEVVGENSRHTRNRRDWIPMAQSEYLADEIRQHHAYGENVRYLHGHHGNAILSRYPLVSNNNYNVSIGVFSKRGILHVETEKGVHLLCVHFGLLAWERRHQGRALLKCLDQIAFDAPVIVAGDFNDWRSRTHQIMLNCGLHEALHEIHGRPPRTYPVHYPLFRMDRIYYRNLELITARRLDGPVWKRLADHCPLYAEFKS
ncbi:MAG: endonuclease/exonuclease/phosphatase family protein [Proteobacteria bacterium]|nr:endonuclease/exonuclease/phosphatase family protein [Pseudomonadota bacterium]MBU1688835.1 endonuclease/exonuclease/phosphatase family protein [Pseudomonadota bacterium]